MSRIRIGDRNRFAGPTAIGDNAAAADHSSSDRSWAARHPWLTGAVFCVAGAVLGLGLTLYLT
jgi:hypothetical protein